MRPQSRLLLAAALAALSSAADAITTLTGPANPFGGTATGNAPTLGALPSAMPTGNGRPGHRSSTASQAPVQTTMSIFTFGPVDPNMPTLVASIISANPTATVLYLTCSPQDDEFDGGCGLGPGLTVTQMGTTAMIDVLTDGTDFSWSESCTFATSPAVCVQSAGGTAANFNGELTTTLMPIESAWITVDVTAGSELLAQATAKATGTAKGGNGTATGAAASATGKSNAAARGWAGLSAAAVAAGAFVAGIAAL
jgi:hypothetical protein